MSDDMSNWQHSRLARIRMLAEEGELGNVNSVLIHDNIYKYTTLPQCKPFNLTSAFVIK